MVSHIQLVSGKAPWLVGVQFALVLLAAVNLVTIDTLPSHRSAALAVLVLATVAFVLAERRRSSRQHVHLDLDGHVRCHVQGRKARGRLCGSPWVSSWFCVLHWRPLEGGKRQHSVICASLNRFDDYRRLLVWLRLAPGLLEGRGR